MRRKELEITLSAYVEDFRDPISELEQYQTPSRTAANLIHRATHNGDIKGKRVLDICAGTGILGIAAILSGAEVTMIELDKGAVEVARENLHRLELNAEIIHSDVFLYDTSDQFDTALLNPPFGIQQKKWHDIEFVQKAHELANIIYSIHDGSPTNQKNLPKILKKRKIQISEQYLDDFHLKRRYEWHSKNYKKYQVLILRTIKMD